MKMACITHLCSLICLSCSFGEATTSNQVDSLLSKIPTVWIDNPDIESFYVKGDLLLTQSFKFCIAGQRPNDISMVVSDNNDVPLFIAKNSQVAVYEPIACSLVHAEVLPVFQVKMEPNEQGVYNNFYIGVALAPKAEDETENASLMRRVLCMDFPSILKSISGEFELEQLTDDSFLLKGQTEKGNQINIIMSESGVESFQMIQEGSSRPLLNVNTIVLNEPIAPVYFEFPQYLLNNDKINISQMEEVNSENMERLMALLIVGNTAVDSDDPEEYRAYLEQITHPDIDFEELRRSKSHYTESMKAVFKDEI